MDTIIQAPIISVTNDYDGVFEKRVKSAIELNIKNNVPMVDVVTIDSGSYRSHCMAFRRGVSKQTQQQVCELDFYAAARVFGFEHTIEDIAKCIAL